MLLLLTGSSAAGKTTLAQALPVIEGLAVHDFDEVGVPANADKAWRQRTMEQWFRRALELQDQGSDLLLACQSPMGEALATPSADRLGGLAVCHVDCKNDDRLVRLMARPGIYPQEMLDALTGWADYMRMHHADPQYRQDVLMDECWPEMRWDRWTTWQTADHRWIAETINTSDLNLDQSLGALRGWIEVNRGRR
jgi:hypothetical protein